MIALRNIKPQSSQRTQEGCMFDLTLSGILWFLLALFVIFMIISPSLARASVHRARERTIRQIETKRGSRMIVMIHRQESVSLLGVPVSRYITIEDSEAVLRAIRLTKPDVPIDIILHTPGGLVLAAEQIAHALVRHQAPVTVMVPHYAMSGGTLLALVSDKIIMDPNAVLGPVDPQLGPFPARGIVELLERKDIHRISDEMLIIGGMATRALNQVRYSITRLLLSNGVEPEKAERLADIFSSGHWTHDYPFTVEEACALGLEVSEEMPEEVYQLMDLYPQAANQRPSVSYIPMPYHREGDQTVGGDKPPTGRRRRA
jgi:ClpP class serine protease